MFRALGGGWTKYENEPARNSFMPLALRLFPARATAIGMTRNLGGLAFRERVNCRVRAIPWQDYEIQLATYSAGPFFVLPHALHRTNLN